MANLTRDELVTAADTAIETAIATLLTGSNIIDRKAALVLLERRTIKKRVTNRHRSRSSNENPGAL